LQRTTDGRRSARARQAGPRPWTSTADLRGLLPQRLHDRGVPRESYAENNFFRTDEAVTPDRFLTRLNGTAIFETGTLVNGRSHRPLVDVVDAYNAANDPDLLDTVGWTPTLFLEIDPTKKVPEIVRKGAGPF
jgi:pectate lyase